MSHMTGVNTTITNRTFALLALDHLRTTVFPRTEMQILEGGQVRGWQGATAPADLVVRFPGAGDIGLRRANPQAPYEVFGDQMLLPVDLLEFQRALVLEYGIQVAFDRARLAGWRNLRRVAGPDGSVLVAGVVPGTPRTLTVTFDKDSGRADIDVSGFSGDECLAATKAMERDLGTVVHRTRKPDDPDGSASQLVSG